jgi:hypothetical protein
MTLIVGILCKDSVVVAADSAATYGVQGQQTITQLTQKIEIIDGTVIVACSGAIGLSQRYSSAMKAMWLGKEFSNTDPVSAGVKIGNKFKEHILPEANAAQFVRQAAGPAVGLHAVCVSIVALPVKKVPTLIQFTEIASPEVATKQLPFVSFGIGQPTADPFLAFLRDIFWKDREPLLSEGVFAALWTLKHAITHTPGGIKEPIDIAVLETVGDNLTARLLSKTEVQEDEQSIREAETALRNFKTGQQKPAPAPPPAPPQ